MKESYQKWLSEITPYGDNYRAFHYASEVCSLLLQRLSKDRLKEIFRALGMTTKVEIPTNDTDSKTLCVEAVIHPADLDAVKQIVAGNLTGLYRGCRIDNFHVIQEDYLINYWELDYVVRAPSLSRKFFYFLGQMFTYQALSLKGKTPRNRHFLTTRKKKMSKKIRPFLQEVIE